MSMVTPRAAMDFIATKLARAGFAHVKITHTPATQTTDAQIDIRGHFPGVAQHYALQLAGGAYCAKVYEGAGRDLGVAELTTSYILDTAVKAIVRHIRSEARTAA